MTTYPSVSHRFEVRDRRHQTYKEQREFWNLDLYCESVIVCMVSNSFSFIFTDQTSWLTPKLPREVSQKEGISHMIYERRMVSLFSTLLFETHSITLLRTLYSVKRWVIKIFFHSTTYLHSPNTSKVSFTRKLLLKTPYHPTPLVSPPVLNVTLLVFLPLTKTIFF